MGITFEILTCLKCADRVAKMFYKTRILVYIYIHIFIVKRTVSFPVVASSETLIDTSI